jgi:hypothetical protein
LNDTKRTVGALHRCNEELSIGSEASGATNLKPMTAAANDVSAKPLEALLMRA